ncbi:TPA: UDP-phosphate galactose phosphotransferase, partial [Klebsiella pneumoniae]
MTLLVRNFIVSIALAISDFFSFVISLYLAIGVLSITISDYETVISVNQLEGWK